jgi:hypothetical protein
MANSHPADRAAREGRTCAACGEASMVMGVCARCGARAAQPPAAQRDGDLEILSELVLYEGPRGRDGSECLRVRYVKARTPQGNEVSWHDLRIYFKDRTNGEWHPTQKGVSIRSRELAAVAAALLKASRGPQVRP